MRICSSFWILLFALCSCDQRPATEVSSNEHSTYPGIVPLFGLRLWSDPEGRAISQMLVANGAILNSRGFGPIPAYQNMRPPIYPTASSLRFRNGRWGPFTLEKHSWFLHGARIDQIYLYIESDTTSLHTSLTDYQRVSQFISDSLGEPVWTNMFKDRLFRDTSYSDRERAFFSEQAYLHQHWAGMRLPLSLSKVTVKGSSRMETIPSLRIWRWSDSGTTWCVVGQLSFDTRENTRGGTDTLYHIEVELIPLPEVDLRKINPELAAQEKEYAGWVGLGSDMWPGDQISLCGEITDSVLSYFKENHLRLSTLPKSERLFVYGGPSPGSMQIRYASDTMDYAGVDPSVMTTRGAFLFVRCRGVVFDTAMTGYDLPILYINTVSEVRDVNDPNCP